MATEKKPVDWAAMEPHYRAGIRSLADLGKEFHCSAPAIVKHAEKNGWTRDLKAKIVAKAEAKVNAATVNATVNSARTLTENAVVEAAADAQFNVRMSHRTDITRTRGLFRSLIQELEVASTPEGLDLFETLRELVYSPPAEDDKVGQQRAERQRLAFEKALGLGGRVVSAKTLTDMLEKLVNMERVAYGIDDKAGASDLDKLLKKLADGG